MLNGVNVFHYAATETEDDDSVLTSGFFSALQSFSQEVRSAKIDFFASETEIFMFDEFDEHEDTSLVIIFKNDIQQNVAREVLNRVKDIIQQSKLFEIPSNTTLNSSEEINLQQQIHDVAMSLISVDFQVEAAKELVETEKDIDLVLLYNYSKDDLYYEYSSEKIKIDKENQFRALRAISRYIIPLIKEYHLGDNFDLISIETYSQIMIIAKNGANYTVCISQDPDDVKNIFDFPFKLMSQPRYDQYMKKYDCELSTSYRIDKNDEIHLNSGASWTIQNPESIIKTIDAIDRLLESFDLDQFHDINIYPNDSSHGYLRLTRNFTRGLRFVEFYR